IGPPAVQPPNGVAPEAGTGPRTAACAVPVRPAASVSAAAEVTNVEVRRGDFMSHHLVNHEGRAFSRARADRAEKRGGGYRPRGGRYRPLPLSSTGLRSTGL